MPASKGSNLFVIYFHGNSEDIGTSYKYLEFLNGSDTHLGINCNILLMEYPGYGMFKDEEPTEELLSYCATRVYDFLRNHMGIGDTNIVVMGRSIGTGISMNLVAKRHPAALILISPFTDITSVAKAVAGEVGSLVEGRFDSLSKCRYVKCPVQIIHGIFDSLIPYSHAEKLAAQLTTANLYLSNRMEHNRISIPELTKVILKFLLENDLYSENSMLIDKFSVAKEYFDLAKYHDEKFNHRNNWWPLLCTYEEKEEDDPSNGMERVTLNPFIHDSTEDYQVFKDYFEKNIRNRPSLTEEYAKTMYHDKLQIESQDNDISELKSLNIHVSNYNKFKSGALIEEQE